MASHTPPAASPAFEAPTGFDDLISQVEDILEGGDRWHTITVEGATLRVRKPQPTAIKALNAATGKGSSAELRKDSMTLFVQHHLHPADWEMILVWMVDPEQSFSAASLGEVMRRIATLGTARPTVRSSRWRRRRGITGGRSGRS
ncbi:hypothetical protein EV641_109163 [Rhodococcus sp. SMB37]|uniref:hypothetical protein n=1 Tax=Rhodococcus sp. SMB37 TaxID=2512213 RepID=UPI0010462577|nr:hypothetical protein [Rhodococcus sp. SMB37]TCN51772.1 hypothetical protein EV641_109163 [Rhodococcus sp. SMB37]